MKWDWELLDALALAYVEAAVNEYLSESQDAAGAEPFFATATDDDKTTHTCIGIA